MERLIKRAGALGESNTGGLTLLAPDKIAAGERGFVENLISEENSDRAAIMRRVIETNENLTENDLPKIRQVFAALNRDKALPGDWIQQENGTWHAKPSP